MKTGNRKKLTAAAVTLMMTVGLMPVNVWAETDDTAFITAEATADEEQVIEEKNDESVSEETDEVLKEEESEPVSDEESFTMEENAEDNLSAFGPVFYYDENRESHICSSYANLSDVIDQPGVTLTSGWYVAEGFGWGFNNRVTIYGDVNIILTDNCGVIFNRGIQNNQYGHLIIWGQKDGNGQLTCIDAFDDKHSAGIGGNEGASAGHFEMHGGIVNAQGHYNGAGIGGGRYGDGGVVSIYGGTVNATGGNYGAGIGGGMNASGGRTYIYGGTVNAAGESNGAGIGGGTNGNSGTIEITGGTVTAAGGNSWYGAGAGIGGGNHGNGETIHIQGGNITATGASWAAGIGGGNCGNGGNITIDGGNIRADGINGGAGIGGGDEGDSGIIRINSPGVEAHGYLAIGRGDGGNYQSITIAHGIGIEGVPYSDRINALDGAKDVKLVHVDNVHQPVSYIDENRTVHVCEEYEELSDVHDNAGVTLSEGWYVTTGLKGFNNRVTIRGEVNIILQDDTQVICNRGIQNNQYGHLIIWGQKKGNGTLECVQKLDISGYDAGIGGNGGASGGIFEMHGGTVNSYGQQSGAGIGGGNQCDGGLILIYGGTVFACSGYSLYGGGAGIGGGLHGSGGTIRIYGGSVTACGGKREGGAAGIGGGDCGDGGDIFISGGTVIAEGGNGDFGAGAGIGGGDEGNGGTITITGGDITASGGNWGAGIGGGNQGHGGTITIDGGTIHANGNDGGAGIGGGDEGDSGHIIINHGTVTAVSRYKQAPSGEYGAGIGAGADGNENEIVISGGRIRAVGHQGVGCGKDGMNGTLKLGDTVHVLFCGEIQPFDDRISKARLNDIELMEQ